MRGDLAPAHMGIPFRKLCGFTPGSSPGYISLQALQSSSQDPCNLSRGTSVTSVLSMHQVSLEGCHQLKPLFFG